MTDQQPTVLTVTDLPFWRRSSGPYQRICQLVSFLRASGLATPIFYLGSPTDHDRAVWLAESWNVIELRTDLAPPGLLARLAWHAAGAWHALARSRREPTDKPSPRQWRPLRLADYRWPPALIQLSRLLDEVRPDVVLVEYAYLAYLRSAQRHSRWRAAHWAIDTHDVLSRRADEFRRIGDRMWLEVTRDEEAAEVARADLILAIQEREREVFAQMAPQTPVMVVGHAPHLVPVELTPNDPSAGERHLCQVGYIGSANALNRQALEWFYDECWPIARRDHDDVRLIVAGDICGLVAQHPLARDPDVWLEPGLRDPLDFYRRVDIVINPIRHGTGLKIKSVEAVAAGRPLVTTSVGIEGVERLVGGAVICADDPKEFGQSVARLVGSADLRNELVAAARQASETSLAANVVYAEFLDWVIHSAGNAIQSARPALK